MKEGPKIKNLRSILKKNIDLIIVKLVKEIAVDLNDNLSEIDELNSDDYGNIYYQGAFLDLYTRLGLVDNSKDRRITGKARQLYVEFKRNRFYR